MSIAIGVSCGEQPRFSAFYDALIHLSYPGEVDVIQSRGGNIAENRNTITRLAIERGHEWVLYLDDDNIAASDTITRLMKHNLDIVSGLYIARQAPFFPQMYHEPDERFFVKPMMLTKNMSGLQECTAIGAGCLLMKTSVFKKLQEPYWRLGQLDKVGWSDDIEFCKRLREAGFKIWCDTDTPVGHMLSSTIWPLKAQDGSWVTGLYQDTQLLATFPAAKAKEPEPEYTGPKLVVV